MGTEWREDEKSEGKRLNGTRMDREEADKMVQPRPEQRKRKQRKRMSRGQPEAYKVRLMEAESQTGRRDKEDEGGALEGEKVK